MEVVSLVGGSLLSATFDFLLEKLNGYLSQLQNSKKEVHAQMTKWKTLLPKITAVLEDAEENQFTNRSVKLWLNDLRDLAYDIEDILEEVVIDAKRSELIAKSQANTRKGWKCTFRWLKNLSGSKAKPSQEINCMVKDITDRLQRIEIETHSLGLIILSMQAKDKSHKVVAKTLPESSLLEDKVWGRDGDKDAILWRLLEDGGSLEQDFIIPIVGMGGVGKTTLARLIYNDEKLEDRFDLKAWVCVSNEFDVLKITRTILEHVTGERCDLDFGLLQEKLKEKLSERKFFLVLDDVWNKEYGQWDVLKRPFMSGAPGSKIIVTTRKEDVGKMMRGDDGVYSLELLQYDACLPLFTWHALGKENFDAHRDLQDVGEKLVKRCKGLPLALKTLGGVLRGKLGRDEWEDILNSKIWHLSKDECRILPALRLSYNDLPSHLKQCFAYCALFPKDYEFDADELVPLWMAEGFLQQQSCGKKQMKEIGHGYFRDLLSRSLFQQSNRDKSRFVMHDLINDLALHVVGETYCNLERIMDDEKLGVNLEKARHLSFFPCIYEISKRFIALDKLKHLRTFFRLESSFDKYEGYHYYLSSEILHDFIPRLKLLRVLSLRKYQIRNLPDSIEMLKHLRYIDLSATQVKWLPDSVGSLLFLQMLLLRDCAMLTKLPTTIGNLIDLNHLDIAGTTALKEMPSGIAHLKNLVTLSKFIVGKTNELMRLSDLKNFSQLQGELSILDLHSVLDVRDAWEANLDKINGLDKLLLEWTSDFGISKNASNDEMQVLEWLKPHTNLKTLTISCYGGAKFPFWLGDSLFSNLSCLELRYCSRCTMLPSLGQLPILKDLIIRGMEAIETVGPEFYGNGTFSSLETLVFRDMLNWNKWTSPTGSGEFRCLRKLEMVNCPKLIGDLPSYLSSLSNFVINGCPKLRCSSMSLSSLKELDIGDCNGMLLKSIVDLTSLTNLRIQKISELTSLPMSFGQYLTALETLDIKRCNDLTCLWEEGIEIEQSLLPFNPKHLAIEGCVALESLPDAIMMKMDGSSSSNSMSRLEKLEITGCHSLKSFPKGKLPITIKSLVIEDCEDLESLPDAALMQDDGVNNSNLHLKIESLPSLNSSQFGQLPASLKKLEVFHCKLESFSERMLQHCTGLQSFRTSRCGILKSLPSFDCLSNLIELDINCEVLESFPEVGSSIPKLESLVICDCKNLKTLPNTMYQLKSLQNLCMIRCPGIECIPDGGFPPNLKKLQLECENLRYLPNTMFQLTLLQDLSIPDGRLAVGWGLQNLTSLQHFSIRRTCPPNIELPSSLTSLLITNVGNLQSISKELLQNLNSLQKLIILNCPRLQCLPKEGLSPSLGALKIRQCPHLKRQLFEANGDYWPLTCSIPCVSIDGERVLHI